MKYTTLKTLLKGKDKKEKIKWEYYGYGFFNCSGETIIEKLPTQVLYSKVFEYDEKNKIYKVDGAL